MNMSINFHVEIHLGLGLSIRIWGKQMLKPEQIWVTFFLNEPYFTL